MPYIHTYTHDDWGVCKRLVASFVVTTGNVQPRIEEYNQVFGYQEDKKQWVHTAVEFNKYSPGLHCGETRRRCQMHALRF